MDPLTNPTDVLMTIIGWFLFLGVFLAIVAAVSFWTFIKYKYRKREDNSLDSVLLEVAVPRDNEIKIDAAEQMFAALYSIKKGGWKQRFDIQPILSFEVVARKEEIKFYVWCPKKLQDLIEKQIHGAYTDAQLTEVAEYNLFSDNSQVAYSTLQLRSDIYNPIKV